MKKLENKVAIVTGAGSGIGKATALLFAKEGAKVVVSDINEEHGKQVTDEILKSGGVSIFVTADSSKPEDHQNLVNETIKSFGKLDIAVNNAGIGGEINKAGDMSIEGWKTVIDINLSGVFYGVKYQAPEMVKNGSGSIINIASILGQVGFEKSAGYVAAKHGVVGLTKSTAWEYAKDKVRVNAVGPGFTYTGLVNEESMGKEALHYLESKHAFGRLGQSQEVANLILFLASDDASFITGSYYPVDGGYLAV